MAHLLGAESIHLEYPTKVVLEDVTVGISEGDRIGIVGRNGDGKSTLLRILLGEQLPDSGRVTRRSDVRVAVLDQSDTLDPASSVGYSIVGDVPDHVWASDPKIRDVIAGLVADLDWDKPVGQLSGGQRRRVALAALLVGDWDVIGLDEPTNHLDIEGIHWLAGHLRQRWVNNAGGLLVITHDRWFLDEICTKTWEVHDRIVEPFEGGYAAYVLQRVERDRQAAVVEAKRQNLMRKELAWLRRGAPARTSKPKFRIDAANVLIEDVPPPRDSLELSRLAVARLGKQVVDLVDVDFAYGAAPILTDVNWKLAPGERTGILGANGAGKSTLLSLIAGVLEPTAGRIKRGKTLQLGVLDQQFSQLEAIQSDLVREVLARTKASFVVDGKEMTPAQLLERLGFDRAHLQARVNELSGGQKRRLQLLMILLAEPNMLILDEPTNDVDTDMLTAMEDLLDSWPGTLVVVSHDRYLLERVTDQVYGIFRGRLRHLPGGVDEYLKLSAQGVEGAAQGAKPAARAGGSKDEAAGASQSSQASGAQRHALGKELAAIERKIAKLTQQREKLLAKMAEHDPADYQKIAELSQEAENLAIQIEQAEESWLELSADLD
ncbi:MAG: ABC-F family ATP-binding cassette domain-containing protein [Actinomycetaceae bacterium]|nr:ABC-F family ATP-binding cassette domain-containing protein [Actinomycetaceae bacterium]